MEYQEFIESKRIVVNPSGFEVDPAGINPMLFEFQRDIVRWSLRKGCLLYTSPSPRDRTRSRMPSSA